MTSHWASTTDVGLDVLSQVQNSLSVGMIMTARASLMTCKRTDTAADVAAKSGNEFSYLPVVDDDDRYLGLYRAEKWFGHDAPRTPIGDTYEPFSEDLVIGADASIFEFVQRADERPTRLVVSGHQVAGLVSLSDLQALPVRAALFTLITSLEIAMAKRIEAEWPGSAETWLGMISPERRAEVLKLVDAAKSEDGFVSEIAFAQLSDKATVIRKSGILAASGSTLKKDFNGIRRLRDNVAHSNSYAETPREARSVCQVVRRIIEIKAELLAGIRTEAIANARKDDQSPAEAISQ